MKSTLFLCASYFCTLFSVAIAEKSPEVWDPKFREWVERHFAREDIDSAEGDSYIQRIQREDPLVRLWIKFRKLRQLGQGEVAQEQATVLLRQLREARSRENEAHPLAEYFLEDMVGETYSFAMDHKDEFQLFKQLDGRSCASRRIAKNFVESSLLYDDLQNFQWALGRIDQSHTTQFRRSALRALVRNAPKEFVASQVSEIKEVVDDDQRLKSSLKAIFPYQKTTSSEDKLNAFVRKKHCKSATKHVKKQLRKKPKVSSDEALEMIKKVGQCSRRISAARRLSSWTDLIQVLRKTHGDEAWAFGAVRLARFYWSADNFEKATKWLNEVTAAVKDSEAGGLAQFVLGQVKENRGEVDTAIDHYEAFVKDWPSHPRLTDALKALTLLYVEKKRWNESLIPVSRLVYLQGEKALDDRDVSIIGFALFWEGRIWLELGQLEQARLAWKRLSREYYSTFYGAMGHYLVEKLDGKILPLAPTQVAKFHVGQLFEPFSGENRQRIARIHMLLRLGKTDDARCELSELVVDAEDPRQRYSKSVLLYAAEQWLPAIRMYGALPRSFRNTLPQGSERILFPRKYETRIQKYSAKLSLDDNFVFSLIRQESVFNPMARSSAGARGLMQLMNATARIEVKKLLPPYVSSDKKRSLIRRKSSQSLYDPETNLILGIHHLHRLLQEYSSPVLALSAYNAGPRAASRWVERYPSDDILLFTERIPYKETRGYVKLILRNYFYYHRWYGVGEGEHLQSVTAGLLASAAAKTKRESH